MRTYIGTFNDISKAYFRQSTFHVIIYLFLTCKEQVSIFLWNLAQYKFE